MKPHFKSFLLLLFINALFILPSFIFLKSLFIPIIALLCVFNIYLYFFHFLKILKHFSFQHFSPNDPWGITSSFNELQKNSNLKNSNLKNISCYKIKADYPLSVCFGTRKNYYIILSENLLETFSEKEIKTLLSYYFQAISKGSISFLTLISGVIYCLDRFLFLLNYPFKYFQKSQPVNFLMVGILYLFSSLTKPLFLKLDHDFAKTEQEKKLWALFIWKVNSLYSLEKRIFPSFFTAHTLTNPLTNIKWECYVSLHPTIRLRVKKLIGSFPP